MSSIRFACALSPDIERRVVSQDNVDELLIFFKHVKETLKLFKHHIVLIVPSSFKAYLKMDEKLKIACSILEEGGSQSNVIFVHSSKHHNCLNEEVSHLFSVEGLEVTTRKIINLIQSRNFPVLINSQVGQVQKLECEACNQRELCSIPAYMPTTDLKTDIDAIKDLYRSLIKQYEAGYTIPANEVSLDQLKITSLLMGMFNRIHQGKLETVSAIECIPEFLHDLQGVSGLDFKNICFSAFRAYAFPPVDDRANAEQFSIDWHEHSPKKLEGVNLFRCDVQNDNERGLRNSGAKRILIGSYKTRKCLLAYTDNHDFNTDLMRPRVLAFKQLIDA